MSIPDNQNDPLRGPRTPEEAEFLAAYRDLDEGARALLWSALLTEVGRRSAPIREAECQDGQR